MAYEQRPVAERFWSKVDRSGDCWVWTASRTPYGYGKFRNRPEKSLLMAHRVSWELTNGPIPPEQFVCHRCDNPPCVRPDHLFLGTAAHNSRDMESKRRTAGRWKQTNRLYPEDLPVLAKLCAEGQTQGQIAARYGVSQPTVGRWLRRGGITRRLSPEEVAVVMKLYAEGQSQAKIAVRYGVTQQTVSQWLRRGGLTQPNRVSDRAQPDRAQPDRLRRTWPRNRLAPEDFPMLRQLRAEGETQAKLAARYGVTQATISRWLNREGS